MLDKLAQNVADSIKLKENFFSRELGHIASIGTTMAVGLNVGRKVLVCGNGGSAADAQHFAAELSGRFLTERRALAGIALTVDSSVLTAIGNDYGFDTIFKRQVQALGSTDDFLVAISTSGNSRNVVEAVEEANRMGLHTIGLLGKDGGVLKDMCHESIVVDSNITARVQEIHCMVYHFWCEVVDSIIN